MTASFFKTLRNILTDLINALVWMVSACLLISKSSSPFTKPLGIVPSVPLTIGITVTFMLHIFLVLWQGLGTYLSFHFLFSLVRWYSKVSFQQVLFFFFFYWESLGLVIWLRLGDLFVSQNPRKFCVSHSPGRILGCEYTTCLHNYQWITFRTQTSLVLYSFCANL